ncbi:MAG: UbiD family decarboxylase [Nitrososphaerales archaeon]
MPKDFRDFLSILEESGELKRVSAEVNPKHELGAVCALVNSKKESPAIVFENVSGSKIPVVSQLLASNRRIALSLGVREEEVFEKMVERSQKRIATKSVSKDKAPCQEVVLTGEEVDLRKLPICTNNPGDGGPYITAGHVFLKDPEIGQNLSIYRMMYYSKNEVFIRLTPGHDGYDFFKNAERRDDKRLEVAVAIGVDPAIYIASQFEPALGVYELEMAGGLKQEPIDVVRCESVDLEVPSRSEIILEGELTIPPKTDAEGPIGEFCGYTTDRVPGERIMRIKAMTHRMSPLYHNIWLGRPPHEHLYVDALSFGVQAYNELHPVYGAIKRAYAPPWGVSLALVIQIDEHLKRPGVVGNILGASLATRSGKWKYVVAVDDDINIYDPNEVLWAITTRFQPHRDSFVIPWGSTSRLEPSSDPEGVTSKLFIDATKKKDFRGTVAEPTEELRSRVKSRWKEFSSLDK